MRLEDELSPRKRPRQARAKATVEAVLDATAQVLVREGKDGLTTQKVAERAGVSVGTLYQYFPTKEALVAAVAQRHYEQMLGLLRTHVEQTVGAPFEAAVEGLVSALLEAHCVNPELFRALGRCISPKQSAATFASLLVEAEGVVRLFLEHHRAQLRLKDLELAAFVLVRAVDAVIDAASLERTMFLRKGELSSELVTLILSYVGLWPASRRAAPRASGPRRGGRSPPASRGPRPGEGAAPAPERVTRPRAARPERKR